MDLMHSFNVSSNFGLLDFQKWEESYNYAKKWYNKFSHPYLLRLRAQDKAYITDKLFQEHFEISCRNNFRTSMKLTSEDIRTAFQDEFVQYNFKTKVASGLMYYELSDPQSNSENKNFRVQSSTHIYNFALKTAKERDALIDYLQEKYKSFISEQDSLVVYQLGYDGWIPTKHKLTFRSLDHVFVQPEVKNNIITSLNRFYESESFHLSRGIPWHWGMCLYGVPGSGKSSLLHAIVSEYGFKPCYVSPSDVNDPRENIEDLFLTLPESGFLIFEDFDNYNISRTRDDETNKNPELKNQALAQILAMFDSPRTPHGLKFAITTNRIDDIDSALLRPGRIQCKVSLDYLSEDNLNELLKHYFPQASHIAINNKEVTGAEITALCLDHMYQDSSDAIAAIEEFIANK